MTPYQHCVSGFFVKQEEAESALAELVHRGIPTQQLALYVQDPQDLQAAASTHSPSVLKNTRINPGAGAAIGSGIGDAGDVALATHSVTLFVASPLIAPLAMMGWRASLGAGVGTVAGAICFNKPDGKLADLVADAIQSGQVVLMVTTRTEQQTSVAIDIIQSAVGSYQDEAWRRGCASL